MTDDRLPMTDAPKAYAHVMDQNEWDERYREQELVWAAEPNRILVGAVEGLTPGKALDLAAGEGRNAVWLAQQGWDVDAVDWSDVALDKGRDIVDMRALADSLQNDVHRTHLE